MAGHLVIAATDDGFCPSCRQWAQDYPAGWPCPWCHSRALTGEHRTEVQDDPVAALKVAQARMAALVELCQQVDALRREAARAVLGGDLVPASGYLRRQVEQWARPLAEIQCPKGHKRSEHGVWSADGGRWRCGACGGAAASKKDQRTAQRAASRRRAERVRDRWAAYEARMAKAQEVERLRMELPPPVRPPGKA